MKLLIGHTINTDLLSKLFLQLSIQMYITYKPYFILNYVEASNQHHHHHDCHRHGHQDDKQQQEMVVANVVIKSI